MLKRKNRAMLRIVLEKDFKRVIALQRVLVYDGSPYSVFVIATFVFSLCDDKLFL